MRFSRIVFAAALALNIVGAAGTAAAQDAFPRKVIRIVVGFPPGVPADVMTRILAPKLAEGLGQQVIVENKPGAGSSIAGDHVAKSDPDGHTLFMSSIANSVAHSANKVSYHLADDLAAVSLIADVPGVLVAHPSMPATLKEFVAAAKAKPGEFAFGSSGTGSSSHLFGELLNLNADTKLLHVPYRGSSQTLTDLIAGRIQAFFSPASTVLEQIKSGNVRALAVMGEKRMPLLADVPTFAEQGYQGFEAAFWFGLNVPKATPQAVVQRLNKEIVRVMALPDVREKLQSHTIEPTSSSPAAFDAFLRRDIEKWARVVSAAGIKPE
jgi:tripartite-type tricarboxylate transporter receptor subunit TctC